MQAPRLVWKKKSFKLENFVSTWTVWSTKCVRFSVCKTVSKHGLKTEFLAMHGLPPYRQAQISRHRTKLAAINACERANLEEARKQ